MHGTLKRSIAGALLAQKQKPPASCRGETILERTSGRLTNLRDLQVLSRGLAAIFNELIFDGLVFVQGGEPGTLDRGDMDEHVLIADSGLDEPITLGRVEPLTVPFATSVS